MPSLWRLVTAWLRKSSAAAFIGGLVKDWIRAPTETNKSNCERGGVGRSNANIHRAPPRTCFDKRFPSKCESFDAFLGVVLRTAPGLRGGSVESATSEKLEIAPQLTEGRLCVETTHPRRLWRGPNAPAEGQLSKLKQTKKPEVSFDLEPLNWDWARKHGVPNMPFFVCSNNKLFSTEEHSSWLGCPPNGLTSTFQQFYILMICVKWVHFL